MAYYIALPILALAAALQISLFPGLHAGAAQLELVLVIVLSWSVHASWQEALFWAFTGGIMQDLVSITPTGTSVIAPLITILVMKSIGRTLYRFNFLLLFVFIMMGTILHHFVLVIALSISSYPVDIQVLIQNYSLPTLVYNLIATAPIYWLLRRIQKRMPQPQSVVDIGARL